MLFFLLFSFFVSSMWYRAIGVMQATSMSGAKLEKRYSPSFHEDSVRKMSASKRKRDDVLRLVFHFIE